LLRERPRGSYVTTVYQVLSLGVIPAKTLAAAAPPGIMSNTGPDPRIWYERLAPGTFRESSFVAFMYVLPSS
jgi:hypothetical protein